LEKHEITTIADRTSSSGSVFTDGCGTISPDLAEHVSRKLQWHKYRIIGKNTPSYFQFRLGGAKGVLVQDPTLTGRIICLRPSQKKFKAPDIRTLDIQSTSSYPKAMFLNRPLIVLLEHHGVKPEAIVALQSADIREIEAIRTSLTCASKAFLQHGLGESFRLPALFRNIHKLLRLDVTKKRFQGKLHNKLINDVLFCVTFHSLREVKYRAHILIPGSFTVLGVSDEWNCLEEGEIYATIYDETTLKMKPIVGQVLITRSPQVHPGDIQLVTAVRRPELQHLTNVVVFSCK
jgi:RNA-dependent RNA polymerase